MATFTGTSGGDDFVGTAGNDHFHIQQGGNDEVFGDAGRDKFKLGPALNALDAIDGGAGRDWVKLANGLAAGPLVMTATTMTNVEKLFLSNGSYDITTHDATVAANEKLYVDTQGLGAGNTFFFDGSAETDGKFEFVVGTVGGCDATVTGGAKADAIFFFLTGEHVAYGGDGRDFIFESGEFSAGDSFDGGRRYDQLSLGFGAGSIGSSGSPVVFSPTYMTRIEELVLNGDSYIQLDEANVRAGKTLTVSFNAFAGATAEIDGSGETNGSFHFFGGNNTTHVYTGGAGNDQFDVFAFLGANDLDGGGGDDVFNIGSQLDGNDQFDGGSTGVDILQLSGDYADDAIFSIADGVMTSIDILQLGDGDYFMELGGDGTVAAGESLLIDFTIGTHTFDSFSAFNETDASGISFAMGAADATLGGSQGNDVFGGFAGGGHLIEGYGGADTYRYTAADQSTSSTGVDSINNLDAANDKFDTTATVGGVESGSGSVSNATFDADINAILTGLDASEAGIVTVTGGDHPGTTFVIVDLNGDGTYTGGSDLCVAAFGIVGTFDVGDFI